MTSYGIGGIVATTKNLADVIRRRLAVDKALAEAVENERFHLGVGAAIHEARARAGLTQQELARRSGMRQSAVARLENADYDGHSLRTLRRIADALGARLEITFVGPAAETPPERARRVKRKGEPRPTDPPRRKRRT